MALEPLTFKEAGLAEHFMWDAFDALMATGDAEKLGITDQLTGTTPYEMAVNAYGQRQQALEKRMGFARAAVLWTALAVEAGANYYIAATLPGDQVALDDLKTVNKLLVAPRPARVRTCSRRTSNRSGSFGFCSGFATGSFTRRSASTPSSARRESPTSHLTPQASA